MKTVVICGSRRYKPEIRAFAKKLAAKGIVVFEPILNTNPKIRELENDLKNYAFMGLTWHQIELIRKANVVFIYNRDGYMGNSSTLELGAAAALGKTIYALEPDKEESCRSVLFDKVVGSSEELIKLLK